MFHATLPSDDDDDDDDDALIDVNVTQVWNLETFEREKTIVAHDNPIGTLVAARAMLFGGSLKVIKV